MKYQFKEGESQDLLVTIDIQRKKQRIRLCFPF